MTAQQLEQLHELTSYRYSNSDFESILGKVGEQAATPLSAEGVKGWISQLEKFLPRRVNIDSEKDMAAYHLYHSMKDRLAALAQPSPDSAEGVASLPDDWKEKIDAEAKRFVECNSLRSRYYGDFFSAFKAGALWLQQQLHPQPAPVQWVKASERLPGKNDTYYLKCFGFNMRIARFEDGNFFDSKYNDNAIALDLVGVEWLDESATHPQPAEAVGGLRPCDCKDSYDVQHLEEAGIGHNDESLTVSPNYVLLTMGHTEIKIGMNRFKMFAEWYLTPQSIKGGQNK